MQTLRGLLTFLYGVLNESMYSIRQGPEYHLFRFSIYVLSTRLIPCKPLIGTKAMLSYLNPIYFKKGSTKLLIYSYLSCDHPTKSSLFTATKI